LYEAVPFIGQSYAEMVPGHRDRIPRILKWRSKKSPRDAEVEKLIFQTRRRVSLLLKTKKRYLYFSVVIVVIK
jgi:hypothetical protein